MAGSAVMALGAGTIILLVLWTLTVFVWVVLHRSQSSIRYLVFIFSSVVTLTLFLLPPDTGDAERELLSALEEEIVYDYAFIGKALLILFLTISLLGGMVLNIAEYWTMKVHGSKAVPLAKKSFDAGPTSSDLHEETE
ncbi:unnamed protein product [Allacma fusca]|uniref:Transmembrane protein 218 n=1 Tax=Allacma fusca TaxID=39272 RepID=A0A8J2P7E1_9HEXA|nr:unnamed protein product [Allacma fusca]